MKICGFGKDEVAVHPKFEQILCKSVKELTDTFHEVVDDYIEYCKEEGIEPHKSYSGSLNIRISPKVHSKIAILAKQAGISINAFIKSAVEKQVAMML